MQCSRFFLGAVAARKVGGRSAGHMIGRHLATTTTALLLAALATRSTCALESRLAEAQRRLYRGNYAEAQDAFRKLSDEHPISAALGISRCLAEQGRYREAIETVDRQLQASPETESLRGERARLALAIGNLDMARQHLERVLAAEPQHIASLCLDAELAKRLGRTRPGLRGPHHGPLA